MLSLALIITVLVFVLLGSAWAAAWAARLFGSLRGQLKWGLAAVLVQTVIGLGVQALLHATDPGDAATLGDVIILVLILVAWLVAIVFVTKRLFQLSTKRAFAPLAAELAAGLIYVGVLLLVVVPFLFEAFAIPTGSMGPTIEAHDRLAVSKLLSPRRWDIMVYQVASGTGNEPPLNYCKRLIGLPGERLRFEDGELYINDQKVEPPAVLAGRLHATIADVPPGDFPYRDGETISLGADEYFFIGDNVDRSKDSRFERPSHRDSLIGVVDLLYWPPGRFHIFR